MPDPVAAASPPTPAAPVAAEPAPAPVNSSPAPAPTAAGEGAPALSSPPGAPSPPPEPEAKPPEAKPAETKPAEPAKPAEAPKPAETPKNFLAEAKPEPGSEPKPTEPVVYQPFNLPEGQSLDEKRLGEFTSILGEYRAPQELGQKLIDLYMDEVGKFKDHQQNVWDRLQEDWLNQIREDPEIGGSRIETVARRCGMVIERFGSQELRDALKATGMGNHPAMVRFVDKIGQYLGEGKPVPAARPAPAPPPSKAVRRYGQTTMNGAGTQT